VSVRRRTPALLLSPTDVALLSSLPALNYFDTSKNNRSNNSTNSKCSAFATFTLCAFTSNSAVCVGGGAKFFASGAADQIMAMLLTMAPQGNFKYTMLSVMGTIT